MKLYTKVPIDQCWRITGKAPIGTRWIDINKQDEANPLYRSRLVGQEFNTSNDVSLYAATPPLELLRTLISIAASNRGYKLMTNDVSRAYFYAPMQEGHKVIVKLPSEDTLAGEEGLCDC